MAASIGRPGAAWLGLLGLLGLALGSELRLGQPGAPAAHLDAHLDTLEVRLGFLVGSRRDKSDGPLGNWRLGRQLVYALNVALEKVNQQLAAAAIKQRAPQSGQLSRLKFVALIGETFGRQADSIKQTVELITRQRANAIVGPQAANCQVESSLASVFDIAMLSYYSCSLLDQQPPSQPYLAGPISEADEKPTSGQFAPMSQTSLIQTRPPHWKVVERVVTLVGQMLAANNYYPQQLVLLYSDSDHNTPGRLASAAAYQNATRPASPDSGQQSERMAEPTSEPPGSSQQQYRLIGELLQIKLNELLLATRASAANQLAVFTWNATFHYGYTRNPFTRLVRRHLSNQRRRFTEGSSQPFPARPTCLAGGRSSQDLPAAPLKPDEQRAAIYIVVGHYYEHLGLMLALDQLNLLSQEPQSSVLIRRHWSLVIGVDTEQYDQRHDSVRFLRGLLMDHTDQPPGSSATSIDPNAVALMYRNYLGIMPSGPTQPADFLFDPARPSSSETSGAAQLLAIRPDERQSSATLSPSSVHANQTLELSSNLFHLIRLPVEAFYLYDSISLLGAYFQECIHERRLSLAQCSQGHRVFRWFRGRKYTSFVDQSVTLFDSMAQTEGSYTLIARRLLNDSAMDTHDSPGDEEPYGELAPIGRFLVGVQAGQLEQHRLEINVEPDEIDPIWLPLWCHVRRSNSSRCLQLAQAVRDQINRASTPPSSGPFMDLFWCSIIAAGSLLTLSAVIGFLASLSSRRRGSDWTDTDAWFTKEDEDNFLTIVYKLLVQAPEFQQRQHHHHHQQQHFKQQQTKHAIELPNRLACQMVGLHCNMFAFPSCKFVHWITALHQLMEMMFQYQSGFEHSSTAPLVSHQHRAGQLPLLFHCSVYKARPNTNRAFFLDKHQGSASLRLLLNKYKHLNECACNLFQLQPQTVAQLHGITIDYTTQAGDSGQPGSSANQNRVASLLIEQPERGNLRQALASLELNLAEQEATQFKGMLIVQIIEDLLDGLEYLHQSKIQFHGALRATNCVLTLDWKLKLSGFHEVHLRRALGDYNKKSLASSHWDLLLYSAPELLELHDRSLAHLEVGSLQLADIYSFAHVVYELLVGKEPWSCLTQVIDSEMISKRAKVDSNFRPPLSLLSESESRDHNLPSGETHLTLNWRFWLDMDAVSQLLSLCWSHSPQQRPQSVSQLKDCWLKTVTSTMIGISQDFHKQHHLLTSSTCRNTGSDMKSLLFKFYTQLLEDTSQVRNRKLELERRLRWKLLPDCIVNRLTSRQRVESRLFDCISLCVFRFFMPSCVPHPSSRNLDQLRELLVQLYKLVDSYHRHLHLVDSQVDSSMRFMVYAGTPLTRSSCGSPPTGNSSQLVASFALQLIDLVNRCQSEFREPIQVRCGLHCGPVLGGLLPDIGLVSGEQEIETFCGLSRYVLIGATMQKADALEYCGSPQRIQLSSEFRLQLSQNQPHLAPESLAYMLDPANAKGHRQGYIMVKRETKISARNLAEFEAHFLLNGPRLTRGQSLTLAAGSISPE